MFKAFLIKYSEIGLKGKNRYLFEDALISRINASLKQVGQFNVSKEQGRIFVECPDQYDYQDAVDALKKVFGISSICPVVVLKDSSWDNLTKEVGEYVDAMYPDKNFTFKVHARRADKNIRGHHRRFVQIWVLIF